MTSREDALRLKIALGWLESHRKRRQVERDSVANKLEDLNRQVERIDREIEDVKSRLEGVTPRPDDSDPSEI